MKRALITAAIAVVPFIALPAAAQTAPAASPAAAPEKVIVATVDGDNIYSSDVVALFQTLPEQYRQGGLGQMADQIVERLIEQTLVSNAARRSGMAEIAEVKRRIKVLSDGVLQQMYLENKIGEQLTDEALKAAYREQIASAKRPEEIRARHILVKTEVEAQKIIAELGDKGDFAAAAKKHSTGPSGAKGGDLGFFSDGMMVPEFSKAAFALKAGEFTKAPVKTQFGWHIIKLEERRKAEAAPFNEVAPRLRQELGRKAFEKVVGDLRAKAKISRPGRAPKLIEK
jgi:peptidyl-prolyl cis-trans isomerase C